MIGILVEKPSAAKNFAKALGGMKGSFNGESYVIANAVGHIYQFPSSPADMVDDKLTKDRVASWNIDYLPWDETKFKWDKKISKGKSDVAANIKRTFKDCDEICIATDLDPSGEGGLLAWEILEKIKKPKRYTRMDFMDEAPASLQKAFKNRRVIQSKETDPEFMKADLRSKFDYLSMQFTRIATKCGDGKTMLRQGRLKSAMVVLVGDALKVLEEYKKNKKPFYQNRFRDENGVMYTWDEEPRFESQNEVPKSYKQGTVELIEKSMKKTAPKKLLDLSSLSSMLASKGYKARHVLDIYQKLYEAQIVSYPRTEDKVVTPEQFKELLPHVDKIANVVGVDPKLLTHRKPRTTHVKEGGAHGANRPGLNVPKSLDSLKAYGDCAPLIYEILAKNYLAILAEDYEYENQKGRVREYPNFVGSTNVPKFLGWKAVFNADADEDDDVSNGLGKIASPFVHEGFPPKPPTPTMKWLMKELDKKNVGTGATRTSTYAEVTSTAGKHPSLLKDTKGKITMTDAGD